MPGFPTHLLLIPLAEIVGVIVPLPGGIGALEGAVQKAYEMAGFQPGLGFLAAGAYRVTTVVIAAIGAGFYMTARRRIQSILAESDQSSDEADDEERPAESTGET